MASVMSFPDHVPRELIGRGEKKSFEGRRARRNVADRRRVARGGQKIIAGEKSFLGGKIRDIEHRESLGNNEFLYEHPAVGDCVVHFEWSHRMIEEIFARLQSAAASLAAQNFKGDPAAHHAIFGQQARDRALRRAVRNVDINTIARESLIRPVQSEVEISRRHKQQDQEDEEGPAHVSLAILAASANAYGPDNLAG